MKDGTKILIGVGVAGGILALVLWPKKAAAGQQPSPPNMPPPQQLEFQPGVTAWYQLQPGFKVDVALPPAHAYHVDDFTGVDTIVGTNVSATNPSTGYSYFTLTALAPGKVNVIIDTKGETSPMTITIEVAT